MKKIVLDNEKKLRIYTLPLRQRIMREMSISGVPMTAKQIADLLEITPSSAQHHMKQLMSIGLIEEDHHELINGIRANYMRLADVIIGIGSFYNDALAISREAFMQSQLNSIYNSFKVSTEAYLSAQDIDAKAETFGMPKGMRLNDVLTGIMHLTDEDADELYDILLDYVNDRMHAKENTHPWEIAVVAYRMDSEYLKESENNT